MLSQRKEIYLTNLDQVRHDLVGIVMTYLREYFPDLLDGEIPKKEYHATWDRFFSSHGQEGYDRARRLLEKFNGAEEVNALLRFALQDAGDGELHNRVIAHLWINAVTIDSEEFSEETFSRGMLGVEAVDLAQRYLLRKVLFEGSRNAVEMRGVRPGKLKVE